MNTSLRRTVVATTAVAMALGMAACGKAGGSSSSTPSASSSSSGSSSTASKAGAIGLLLPDDVTTRYAAFDRPDITSEIKKLCATCTVDYADAAGSSTTQATQMNSMILRGDKVIILDAEDSKGIQSTVEAAVAKGVKVIAYDRLAQGPVSAYVSYDNVKVGELQGQALLDAIGSKLTSASKIVEIDGAASDPNAAQFKQGFTDAVKGKADVVFDESGNWDPVVAHSVAAAAIQKVGAKNIAAVYSANDGMAAGIVTALKAAGIAGVPMSGQDAQIDAMQRILGGTQSFTIFKSYAPEATDAAKIAVALLQGSDISSLASTTTSSPTATGGSVPSDILTPLVVNKANMESVIVQGGLYTAANICNTPALKTACTAGGIS
jgi:ABC-type xylose transport system substrate-binding protein